jgi:hypothetical protein
MASAYIIRSSGVAHETIDGETVILDMQEGAYYRLDGAASMAWSQLSHGATAEQLCATLAACFAAEPTMIETQVTEFLDALRNFNLIVTHEGSNGAALPSVASTAMAFPGLAIHRFTDLKELFWLDPVHEVDDTGWPTTRPKSD